MDTWASFPFVKSGGEEAQKEAICAWFCSSTPAQEAVGDIACASFDNVRCVRVPNVHANSIVLDMHELHPISHAFVVFYYTEYQTIHVLGGLLYDAIVALKGIITIGMLSEHRNRTFFAPYTMSDLQPMDTRADGDDDDVFYINAWFGEAAEYGNLADATIPMSAFSEKLEWYRACERCRPTDPLPPLVFSGSTIDARTYAVYDKGTSIMARLLADCIEFASPHIRSTPVDPRKLRARFDAMRYEAEYRIFMKRMRRCTKEETLTQLFKFNGLWPLVELSDLFVDGTTLDHQHFYAAYRNLAQFEPIFFVNIAIEEVPPALLARLPIYHGGRVHLPFYWETVGEWLWHKYMNQMHLHYTTQRSYTEPADGRLKEWMQQERRIMCRYMLAHKPGPQRRQFGVSMSAGGAGLVGKGTGIAIRQADEKGLYVEDIEDFWAMMPPCMEAVRHLKRFPRNLERLRFAQVLWMAGMSEAAIALPLRDLNERYPHSDGAQRFESRFNIKGALDSIRKLDKQKATNWCSNIVRETMLQIPDVLHCPFVERVPSDVARLCKPLCCSTVRFSAPQELIEHALKGQMPVKKEEAVNHAPDFSEESGDEEEEEEEEEDEEEEDTTAKSTLRVGS
jgi:hypothetical protein